jgi:hypothetical protein
VPADPPQMGHCRLACRSINTIQFEVFPGHEDSLPYRFRDCDDGELAFSPSALTQTDGAAEVSPPIMSAGINCGVPVAETPSSVAGEFFERVCNSCSKPVICMRFTFRDRVDRRVLHYRTKTRVLFDSVQPAPGFSTNHPTVRKIGDRNLFAR